MGDDQFVLAYDVSAMDLPILWLSASLFLA